MKKGTEEINSNRKTAIIVGVLFLTAMVTYLLGASIIESILNAPDYLIDVFANKTQVIIGVILELINVTAVVGIARNSGCFLSSTIVSDSAQADIAMG